MNRLAIAGLLALGLSLVSIRAQEAPAELLPAIQTFMDALDDTQKTKVVESFNSEERLNWHYFPKDRKGLSLKQMSVEQQMKAFDLLNAVLSKKGYQKSETIRQLEGALRDMGGDPATRDPDLYYITIFGAPSEKGAWGLRYEGHHLSFNWTLVDGNVIGGAPQFLGANPAEVKQGPMQGTRALGAEEDIGRSLVASLTEDQRKIAVLDVTAPPEILTGANREAAIQEDKGISYAQLDPSQQGLLLSLIQEFAAAQPAAVADDRLRRIRESGMNDVKFAWMGGLEKGQGHYYRIQGATFLIEYDNTQTNANHIHAVWRDFARDFGLDILKEHYKQHASSKNSNKHEH